MPTPSREDYNAAAARVAASAPPGLTREQFYQRVDSALASRPSLVEQMGSRPTGGYTMSDSDSTDHPVMDALSSAAHPQTAGDMAGLMIPSEMAALTGMRNVRTATQSLSNPARTTMRDVIVGGSKGVGEALTHPSKSVAGAALGGVIGGPAGAAVGAGVSAVPKIVRGIRAQTAERVLANAPKTEGMATGYDRFMPNVSTAEATAHAPELPPELPPTPPPTAPPSRSLQQTLLTPQQQALIDELWKGEPKPARSRFVSGGNRQLSPGEERGISELDAIDRFHGRGIDAPSRGNGFYVDPNGSAIEQLMRLPAFAKLAR